MDLSLIFSLVALAGTAYTYFAHDKKLKIQEEHLNQYQIKKNHDEELAERKALVRANLVKGGSNRVLKIFNSGKYLAKNIDLEIVASEDAFHTTNNPFPYEFLNPQESTEIHLFATHKAPEKFKIIITWDDGFKSGNVYEQMITL